VLYWRNIAGQTIAETDSAGSTSNAAYHEYVFFAGRRVARSDPSSGSVYYFFVDQVGSTRIVTQANGAVCFDQDYFPYGQEVYTSPGSCPQSYKFTGYERDAETGLDYAFARYYNARLARFMSGDPLAGDVGDPQSLNRYAYVRNNPINFIDPTGLDMCPGEAGLSGCGLPFEDPVYNPGPRDPCYNGCPLPKTWRPNQHPAKIQEQTGQPQDPCVQKILDAINSQFQTDLSTSDLVIPANRRVDTFTRGGGRNIYVRATGKQSGAIRPERYSLNPRDVVGPTLHIPRDGEGSGPNQAVFERGRDDVLGEYVIFTAHLDSANPSRDLAGAVTHLFVDVLKLGRDPCPAN
jgi:RHS repeat-associated protein